MHTRGPRGDTWWPLLLFSFWVLVGAAIARLLEWYYGSGIETAIAESPKRTQAELDQDVALFAKRIEKHRAEIAGGVPEVMSASFRKDEVPTAARLSFIDWILQRVRGLTLAAVSLAIAYMLLFDGECSYGSPIDSINTFLWGLGLTQAGNAVIGEAISKYTKPQKP